MGLKCPICGLQVAIVEQIRSGASNSDQPESVMAKRLSCGHVIGGDTFDEYVLGRDKILKEEFNKIQRIEQDAASKIAQLWKNVENQNKESADHAE